MLKRMSDSLYSKFNLCYSHGKGFQTFFLSSGKFSLIEVLSRNPELYVKQMKEPFWLHWLWGVEPLRSASLDLSHAKAMVDTWALNPLRKWL